MDFNYFLLNINKLFISNKNYLLNNFNKINYLLDFNKKYLLNNFNKINYLLNFNKIIIY